MTLLAWEVPAAAQAHDSLELSGHGLTCIDDAAGWYVARVVRLDHRGRFDLQVVTTVHGRPQRAIDLKSHLSNAQWHQLRNVHEGQRTVIRMPYYVASGEGELGGCRSFFFEGGTSSDLRAFPVGQRFKRGPSEDDLHVRLAYLQTYFAARSDPSARRLVADLGSGEIPVELAAVDVLGQARRASGEAWDTLGPPLSELVSHPPETADPNRWSAIGQELGRALRASIASHETDTRAPPARWKDAERSLMDWMTAFPPAYGFAASALRHAGFRLDKAGPDGRQLNAVRIKLGMPSLPVKPPETGGPGAQNRP